MATVTHVCTLDYVAGLLDEDPELLDAILSNSDNLTYGSIITVHTGTDEAITTLTDDGIDELTDMLSEARLTTETWHRFLDDFEAPRVFWRLFRLSHATISRVSTVA